MAKDYKNIWAWLAGYKRGSDPKSNQRRLASRCLLFLSIIFTAEIFLETSLLEITIFKGLGLLFAISGFWFFLVVVVLMPFRDKAAFKVDPQRLLTDSFVSALFLMVSFALIFRVTGIEKGQLEDFDSKTHLYFSIVTFSTLGYGDLTPSAASRLIASIEALLGNLHLGFIVGSVFAVLNRESN